MSRPDHIAKRFQKRYGESWWNRRFADLVERKYVLPDGTPDVKPFNYNEAHKFDMAIKVQKGKNPVAPKPHRAATPTGIQPPMAPRPPGMSRQTHRRLYREACKIAGVPYRQ